MKAVIRVSNLLPLILLATGLFTTIPAWAVQILIDEPVRAGELTLFPSRKDNKIYYYVLDKPGLATDKNGEPQFSFLRFVEGKRSGATETEAREGTGGGIVHALVTLKVTDEQLRVAQRILQRTRPGAKIQGPVIYKSGRFALISSFADDKGGLTEKVLGIGNAPVLDGQKAAISLLLTRQGSKILWQSFQTPTPDISFSFEMELEGYRSPVEGSIEANYEQIYNHKGFKAGVASTYLSAEIKGVFDDLYKKDVIKVTSVGSDDDLQKMLDYAYKKLTDSMFQSTSSNAAPSLAGLTGTGGQQTSMLDRASAQLTRSRDEARNENTRIRRENREAEERERRESAAQPSATTPATGGDGETSNSEADDEERPARYSIAQPPDPNNRGANDDGVTPARQEETTVPALAIVASFEMKQVRQRGIFSLSLNKYNSDTITLRFDENIGDLRRFLGDESHFRQANLDDPLYRQREISVFLDGMNNADFASYANFVTVQMRKNHAGGETTQDEIRIDKRNFSATGNQFKLLYGWKGDNNRDKWLNYDFRTLWSFHGGYSLTSEWKPARFGAINVTPPMIRRSIQIEADPEILREARVRSATVKIYYQLGDKERVEQVVLSVSRGDLSSSVDYITAVDSFDYEYEITWNRRGLPELKSGRKTSSNSILYADEIPGA